MGEYNVHTVRFYDFKPQAIHCVQYDENQRKIALSRADNSIEIWDLSRNIYQEKIIPGNDNRSIEALIWFNGRLFSTGLNGDLTEYDLFKLCAKKSIFSTPGACWCMDLNANNAQLAVGTEEGNICLFDISNEPVYERALDKQKGRILCLSWHDSGNYIVTGSIDVIRLWNVQTGHLMHRILVGRDDSRQETIVWCVKFTKDFQIISGDSRGKVCFWDGKLGTQLESIQSHKGDVLTLCMNKNENVICASGVDPSVISFQRVFKQGRRDKLNWVKTSILSPHTHDVRALTFADVYLVSGGVDSYLNVIRYCDESRSLHSPIPQCPNIDIAYKKNVVLLRYPKYLELWSLGSPDEHASDGSGSRGLCKLVHLRAKENESIVCCAVSSDAQWLSYSTTTQLRLFQVVTENVGEDGAKVSLLRVRYIPPGCFPCHRMCFSPDSSHLIVVSDEGITHVIGVDNIQPRLLYSFVPPPDSKDSIHLLTVSRDGRFVATGDHVSNIFVYDLNTGELQCTLPRNYFQPTAMAFHWKTNHLVVTYADQKLIEYDVTRNEFTNWTRALLKQQCRIRARFPVLNISFDPARDDVIILQDDSRICIVNKSEVLQNANNKHTSKRSRGSKLQTVSSGPKGYHFSYKYKHLVYFGALMGKGEALAVEVNELSLFETLPDLLRRKKFGT